MATRLDTARFELEAQASMSPSRVPMADLLAWFSDLQLHRRRDVEHLLERGPQSLQVVGPLDPLHQFLRKRAEPIFQLQPQDFPSSRQLAFRPTARLAARLAARQ
jgi:hypothetical protein